MPISGGGGTGSGGGGGGTGSEVDVLSVIPGTSATRLGKAEDAAHTTGDVGVMSLAVRKDTGAALATSDGDYAPLQVDADGALRVTGGAGGGGGDASAANQTTIIGHLDGVEGLLTTIDADTSNLSVVGGGTEAAAIRVTVANDSTGVVSVDDNGGSLTVDGTVTANAGTGPWPVTDNGGSLTVDGTVAATQSGTWNVGSITTLPTLANVTTVATVSTLSGGGVAHDGADSGNPVKVGSKSGTADQTAVANNDRSDLRSDALGHVVVRPYALHENLVSGATAAITNTTSTSVVAAAGSGIRNYVTSLLVTNSHATVGTLITITDGSGGATLFAGYAAPVGGGFAMTFPTPLRGSANTAIHAVAGTTGANVYVSASGYKAAV